MAAYAALVSLLQTIDEIEHHSSPPIYLDKEQVESLTENVVFFQEFLEAYSYISNNEEGLLLESRIAAPAHMAEDIIESHIVDQIHDGNYGENIISIDLCRSLQKVIEDMDFIKKEVMEIKETMSLQTQLYKNSSIASAGSSTSSSTVKTTSMVGFDDVLLETLDKLTRGQSGRQIIPIVGMGGIGKTTLAKNVYVHPLVKYHFDICAWVTISLNYDVKKLLNEILCETSVDCSNEKNKSELGEVLYKYLCGRRYLIVLDDMWNIEAWNEINSFFPDNNNGSRIVVTTRLSNLASQLTNSCGPEMKFLDKDKSWDLFSKIVFREDDCPPELKEIGMDIVRSCRGLPLSIVVIAGVLAKSVFEKEYWQHVEANLNSIVNSENDEQCLRVLATSYNQLPVHLKPCFLYMGVFGEDCYLLASEIVQLWVCEGFVKPVGGKNLIEVAKEYLKELLDRNLVFFHDVDEVLIYKRFIGIHDLLRDLSLIQAKKERFYDIVKRHDIGTPHDIRRSVIYDSVEHASLSLPLARSFIWHSRDAAITLQDHRLLRIFKDNLYERLHSQNYQCLVNLRHVTIYTIPEDHLHWNLQTLTINLKDGYGPPQTLVGFWNMTQLRHLKVTPYVNLPDPPTSNAGDEVIVLQKLHTLVELADFKADQEMVKRIPNIKKLNVSVNFGCDLSNLEQLHKLESLICRLGCWSENLTFPQSLKKLDLYYWGGNVHHWKLIMESIGSLPLLHKFGLDGEYLKISTWATVKGHFRSLKLLRLWNFKDLENWTLESSHFPCLERLVLERFYKLNEFPSDLGEIQTLRSICLYFCSESLIISAKRLQEEREESCGEEGALQVVAVAYPDNCEDCDELQSLNSPNFRLTFWLDRELGKEVKEGDAMVDDFVNDVKEGDAISRDD